MVLDNLPDEICSDILSRLPVKTLIRCTTLSKFFNSFITNPNFVTAHLQKSLKNDLLLRSETDAGENELLVIEPEDDNFYGFEKEGLVVPFRAGLGWNVLGSINGVICLFDDYTTEGRTFRMWNPSIRKFIEFRKPQCVFDAYGNYYSVSGFGFDQLTNDYKVVQIIQLDPDGDRSSLPVVEVYSLRSGCWKSLGNGLGYCIRRGYNMYTSCFVNGAVHWVAHSWGKDIVNNVILQFNVSSGTFGVIDVPKCCKHLGVSGSGWVPNLMVKECKGMLGLISMEGMGYYSEEQTSCTIWLLKKSEVVDSWTKVFNLDGHEWPKRLNPFAFAFRDNGVIILARADSQSSYPESYSLVSIDQKHGETVIARHVRDVEKTAFYISTYQESMVLLQEGRSYAMLGERV